MRPTGLRGLLTELPDADTPEVAQERDDWARVRVLVEDICALPADEANQRIESLRVSPDRVQRRAAELAGARHQAEGFLEPPANWPAVGEMQAAPAYAPEQLVGPYRIESVIGEGGMGRVYRAVDTRLLRPVALKVFTTARIRGASVLREAQMAARLHHPNIATVHDVLDVDRCLHIVMEYLHGQPLSESLAQGFMNVDRVVAIMTKILAAVRHAHQAGVIHCDLKPANVFVLDDGEIKVLDFGLARLDEPSSTGESSMAVAGTPRYMAPERVFGARPDVRTDVYSLGVMLEEMLRRVPSSSAVSPSAPTTTDIGHDPRLAALQQVASRAAARDPSVRYASADDLAAAIDAASRLERGSATRRSRTLSIAAVVLAAASALLVAAIGLRPQAADQHRVVSVRVTAPGADPVASYIAAAMQQVLEHSLSGVGGLTIVRAPASAADGDDLGSTHLLAGTVERTGEDVSVLLSMSNRQRAVLASQRVQGPLSSLSTLATALVSGADAALEQSGMAVARVNPADPVRFAASLDALAFEEYAQAREYMRSPDVSNSLDHAIGLLDRAVARAPGFGLGYAGLAEAYWQKYQFTQDVSWTDKARAAALDALRLNPEDPIVRYTLALIYDGMGRRDEAFAEVSKAVTLQPANDDFLRLRGQLHERLGRRELALEDFRTAIRLRPGYWENHRALGLAYFDAGQYDDAIASFARETELRPSSPSAFQALGTAYQAAGREPEAIAAYERALKIRPSANSYANLGMLYYTRGEYEHARAAYEKSVELQPRNPIARRNFGDILLKLGRQREARAEYGQAIVLAREQLAVNPSDVDLLSLQTLCHAKLGHKADVERFAGQLLATEQLPAAARYRTGVAMVLVGNPAGIAQVVGAIDAGYSRAVAAEDDDLSTVRNDAALRAVLERASPE